MQWPNGSYCIAKKGPCPEGFDAGSVYWDDENYRNLNYISGTVPDGEYNSNTLIHYCCRMDDEPSNSVVLPSDRPFCLIRTQPQCQEVVNMNVEDIIVRTDDEDDRGDGNKVFGNHPYRAGGKDNSIRYCHYTPL